MGTGGLAFPQSPIGHRRGHMKGVFRSLPARRHFETIVVQDKGEPRNQESGET